MNVVYFFFSTLHYKFSSEKKRKEITNKRLHKLVEYARQNSPYLRELYKDLPENYTLQDIPIVTKKMIIDNYDNWVTDPSVKLKDLKEFTSNPDNVGKRYHNYLVCKTSGSTGEAVIVLHDQNFLNATAAESLFIGTLSKSPNCFVNPARMFVIPICSVKDNVRRFPFIRKSFQIVDCDQPMEKIVEELNRIQPKTLYTLPSIAEMLAGEQENGRLKLKLASIICNSEMLSDATRSYIEKIFNCRAQSIYGCTELGNVAMECENKRHHLDSYWNILEFVDENNNPVKPGEKSSKILGTNLSDRILPFIRYEVTDSIIYHESEPCKCGNNAPWLELEGRGVMPLVSLKKGDEIVKVSLFVAKYNCTCAIDGLRRLQLAVHGYDEIECRFLSDKGYDRKAIAEGIHKIMSNCLIDNGITDCRITVTDTPPMLHPVSRKMKEIYQDNI